MKIVVEGYDASGKSTLAKALAEKYGLSLVEAGPPPKDMLHAVRDGLNQLYSPDTVHSRITPISNFCYQYKHIDNQYSDIIFKMIRLFERVDTVFIYCVGNSDTHEIKEYDTEEHIEHITENRDTITDRYDLMFSMLRHFRYDFNVNSLEEVICHINQTVKHS